MDERMFHIICILYTNVWITLTHFLFFYRKTSTSYLFHSFCKLTACKKTLFSLKTKLKTLFRKLTRWTYFVWTPVHWYSYIYFFRYPWIYDENIEMQNYSDCFSFAVSSNAVQNPSKNKYYSLFGQNLFVFHMHL